MEREKKYVWGKDDVIFETPDGKKVDPVTLKTEDGGIYKAQTKRMISRKKSKKKTN